MRASLVTTLAKTLVIALVMVALASGFSEPPQSDRQDPAALRAELQQPEVRKAMQQHHCSPTGFGDAASPRSALIRRDGALLHVSFERAWSVFTGEQAGQLLAVCLAER